MTFGYVYIVTNTVNGKKYVGQTTRTVEERWKDHVRNCYRRDFPFPCALRKYDIDKFDIEVICECYSQEELDNKEIFYIREFNTISPTGYNCTEGGRGGIPSEEVKKRISKTLTGKIQSEETKKKRSKSLRGDKNHRYGISPSKEHRKKISNSLKETYANGYEHPFLGRKHTEESIEKMCKTYTFVSLEGEVVKISNLSKFCKEKKPALSVSSMRKVLSGSRSHHRGWTKYREEVVDVNND